MFGELSLVLLPILAASLVSSVGCNCNGSIETID
jgi:hypothetical protein